MGAAPFCCLFLPPKNFIIKKPFYSLSDDSFLFKGFNRGIENFV